MKEFEREVKNENDKRHKRIKNRRQNLCGKNR